MQESSASNPADNHFVDQSNIYSKGVFLLKPNTRAMFNLALGSATTISTLMCIPDAVGIIPVVPDAGTWAVRMLGLWLSAFILWFLGFLTMLCFARFAGGGIVMNDKGVKFWRFGKQVEWANIKAVTTDKQPLFSFAFRLPSQARRLMIFEEKKHGNWLQSVPQKLSRVQGKPEEPKLTPHPIPSFQFTDAEFTSLFVHVCEKSMKFVPNALDVYAFPPDEGATKFLRATSERAALVRKILSVVIAIGLVLFLGRRASLNYFFNRGAFDFRHENYIGARDEFNTATKIDPTYAPGWDQLARAEFRTGDAQSAEKHWLRALQMKPDFVEAKIGMSNIYMRRGELEKARHLLDQCARLVPHNLAIYLNQAEVYTKLGEPAKANTVLEIVEREGAADSDSLARAAKLYFDLGNKVKAKILLDKAIVLNPANTFARMVLPVIESGTGGDTK